MAVTLNVQGVDYTYPVTNDNSWGSNATAWAVAITDAVAAAVTEGDIAPTTQVVIQNDGATHDVTDLVIDSSVTRAALVDYYIYRVKGSTEVAEVGTMRLVYKTNSISWEIDRTYTGDAFTLLTVTTAGQVQYNATVLAVSGSYTGNMRFRVRALPI
jgi:hypothetical protein